MSNHEIVFTVNGLDMLPYILKDGLRIIRNDIDSPDSGRMLDGTMRRDRVIAPYRAEVNIKSNLSTQEVSAICNAVYPQYVQVRFLAPREGNVIERMFYVSTVPSAVIVDRGDGNGSVWDSFSFNMIEVGEPYSA